MTLSPAAFQAVPSVSFAGNYKRNKHAKFTPSSSSRRQRYVACVLGDEKEHCVVDIDRSPPSLNNYAPSFSSSRRSLLSLITIAAASTAPLPFFSNTSSLQKPLTSNSCFIAHAAETIGKDESCNDPSCLGVWDGLLADCPHDKNKLMKGGAGCVSSQDDTPGIFAEPWDYSEIVPSGMGEDAFNGQMDKLILALQTTSKQNEDDVKIVYQEGRYLRALFTDGSGEQSIGEFYFTPNDTTVQFRLASSTPATSSFSIGGRSLSNMDRSERIRKAMRYLKVPVLRNRKRTFFFAESDALDSFGPGSAALGPPEEMSPEELVLDGAMRYGFKAAGGGGGRTRRGSDEVDPKMRIDWTESFPLGTTQDRGRF